MLSLVVGLGTTASAEPSTCGSHFEFVSPTAHARPARSFSGISASMSVMEIVKRIGPAMRDVGSGLHVLQWDVTDGRTFFVSAPSFCGKPVGMGFRKRWP